MIPPARLILSSIAAGLRTYEKPFLISNDAFPTIENALCWRQRLMKKPGSSLVGRLKRSLGTTGASPFIATIVPTPLQHGTSSFFIGNVILTDADITVAPLAALTSSDPSYSGTLNRTTGVLTIIHPVIPPTIVLFAPGLPVMGIEEFDANQDPSLPIDTPDIVYFDTVYSYIFNGSVFQDNSFYKLSGNLVYWNGQDYQQLNSTNYFRALFLTNNNPGAHFLKITNVTAIGGPPSTQVSVTTDVPNNWIVNDLVFFNEIQGMVELNGVTGTVAVPGNPATITVPSNTYTPYTGGGIVQSLTNQSPSAMQNAGKVGDGIRWYDGPGSSAGAPTGFVNFSPPLTSINPPPGSTISYLTGARILIPFGSRLLAIGTYETTVSTTGSISYSTVYYGNRIRYCEVASTPFYANSPVNVTSVPNAWASNIQGFGGFIDLDTTERIISAEITQGSLILGLESEQRRVNSTGIETDPFTFQTINPEYGTAGTQAVVPMDKGILTVGEYGFLITSSYDAQRFDLPILQQIFQINPSQNGFERICGGRDFVNEVVYFTYPSIFDPVDAAGSVFPDTTLVYNYRENSFSLWYESATTYGIFKGQQKTWTSLTDFTWESWSLPWNSPTNIQIYPFVSFGTPQGYVMTKWTNEGTNDPSIPIQAISPLNPDDTYSITSVNHNLFPGAYVGFFPPMSASAAFIGQVTHLGDGNSLNPDSIFSVNFDLINSNPVPVPANIVAGSWQCAIVDQFYIQTKQFQQGWSDAKKTRIGAQKYFLDTTQFGEFTVDILGSQSPNPLNNNTVQNPLPSVISNAVVRTRPDNSLGLNDSQSEQAQIWHRLASSAIGDTVQLQFSLSDIQMRNVGIISSNWVLYTAILDLYPSRILA